jgi:NTE family protein
LGAPVIPGIPPLAAAQEDQRERYVAQPAASRSGIGLCLSGGGYRAALFHLGSLRRLNEFGLVQKLRTVTSVSGGSITSGHLATALATHGSELPASGPIPTATWNSLVVDPLRAFTRKNIRTPAIAQRLLPWNWADDDAGVEALTETYEKHLTPLQLSQLPTAPRFIFCATDMAYGASWIMWKDGIGDYRAGYQSPPTWSVGRAVAASACFPPIFNPMHVDMKPAELSGGLEPAGPLRDQCISDMRLTDGGNYDNMGLEPVWKDHAFVLVSDAGGLFSFGPDEGLPWRIQRYQAIQESQTRALRKRWLISNFLARELTGAYWSVSSACSRYSPTAPGYSKELAREVIGAIRTDLDAFSDAEAQVLENHGYLLADAAIQTHIQKHAPEVVPSPVPPLTLPYPAWPANAAGETLIRQALKDSHRRTRLGRR